MTATNMYSNFEVSGVVPPSTKQFGTAPSVANLLKAIPFGIMTNHGEISSATHNACI